jgi:predicted HAD superfamily Cof-like phosphohydrolase
MSHVFNRIEQFNAMYGLPAPYRPTAPTLARMKRFKEILQDELNEVDEIITALEKGADEVTVLMNTADWLGDLIVYCTSEAVKCGIPIVDVLHIIMDSNGSKLGADGKAIVENGKVQKGPGYWRPEPKIKELLLGRMK